MLHMNGGAHAVNIIVDFFSAKICFSPFPSTTSVFMCLFGGNRRGHGQQQQQHGADRYTDWQACASTQYVHKTIQG